MAKKSQVLRDKKRAKMIARLKDRRAELRAKMKDAEIPPDQKADIQAELDKLPRNSCPTRLTRRCAVSGRSKAVYRKFGMSRIALRELALAGEIPGVTKSSW